MLPYLIFPESQRTRSPNPLSDYKLLGSELLPDSFGPIAPVNIFLGENNSGKSRFMREIMRDKSIEVIKLWDRLDDFIMLFNNIEKIKESTNLYMAMCLEAKVIYSNFPYNEETSDYIDFFWGNDKNGSSYQNKDINIIEKIHLALDSLITVAHIFKKHEEIITSIVNDNILEEIKKTTSIAIKELDVVHRVLIAIKKQGLRTTYDYNLANVGIIASNYRISITGAGDIDDVNIKIEIINKCITNANLIIHNIKKELENIDDAMFSPVNRVYIPILRSARTLINNSGARLEPDNDIFQLTTSHDYDLSDTGVEIDSGFSLYEAIDTKRNASKEARDTFKEFETFLSSTFFNGKNVEVVAHRVRDQRGGNILVAVEGVERDIHNLGDGIQAIVMLLYPLFTAQQDAWFFIEEPETHLHPGFQRLFIETITANEALRSKKLTIFITTHSNHILDFTFEEEPPLNIYTFRRRAGVGHKSTYEIQLTSPRDIQNLTALGVQNSSVFLANCTVWVEGITDRLYFRAYLTAYLNYLKAQPDNKQPTSLLEGLHYAFLEYAGGNISHYGFSDLEGPFTTQVLDNIKALSISNRIMLVADADAGKDTRHEARKEQEHNGFIYRVVSGREVENLLSPVLIVKALNKLFSNHTFAPNQLNYSKYQKQYLGDYIRKQYPTIKLAPSFTADSGTIGSNYKRKFAEAIVASGLAWADLSKPAQSFTKELYQFIISHNPRLGSN